MNTLELSKVIWKIHDEVKENHEKGFEFFKETHKNIPNNCYDLFCNAIIRMCDIYIIENPYSNPITLTFDSIKIYIQNEFISNNPLVKLAFREDPVIDCTSFVKYFKLLKNEGIITNTLEELSDILSSITSFNSSTIRTYLGDIEKTSKSEILLPKDYEKIKKKN
jgi:hypothetical protein